MPFALGDKLVIGITTRALFDLHEANAIFENDGLSAYRAYQRANEHDLLKPGTGFPLIEGLLRINELADPHLVEVIVISRNDADSGMRVFNSIESHGLDIKRAAFTDGREAWPYLTAFECDLFLSAEESDVKRALALGYPAAMVLRPPFEQPTDQVAEVRVAFDGDAVLFDAESERIFQTEGLAAFLEHESVLADEPMSPGPFKPFLMGLKRIQDEFSDDESPIRMALITARSAPAHKRVVNTFRDWGVRLDEAFFLGGIEKAPILDALKPHIYFDDQLQHLTPAQSTTPAAQVPGDPAQLTLDGAAASESEATPGSSGNEEQVAEVQEGASTWPPEGEREPT